MPDATPDPAHPAPHTAASTTHVQPEHTPRGSLAPDYFERLYAAHGDPWSFATSPYESAKYAATLAALPHARYRSGLEIGCAIGVLTRRLAVRCDELLAVDVSDRALRHARERCAGLPSVRFERRMVPEDTPAGPFDLVVLSEVGYYWSEADLQVAGDAVGGAAAPGAHLVLVHYTGETNYPLTADRVHGAFGRDARWTPRHAARHTGYRLDVLERVNR
jgi:SAM-dependent methyltransferase